MARRIIKSNSRKKSRKKRLGPLASLLAAGLSFPAIAAAQSVPYPTYVTGPQPNGSWVVGNGQIISPGGIQIDLGIRVRAKSIALNPNLNTHTAVVLTLGASEAVEVFDTNTGAVLQNYSPFGDSSGSYSGIAYSADGKHPAVHSSPAFRTALSAPMPDPAARSIVRAPLIPEASHSRRMATAPTPC